MARARVIQQTDGGWVVIVDRDYAAPARVLALYRTRYEHSTGADHICADDRAHARAILDAIERDAGGSHVLA